MGALGRGDSGATGADDMPVAVGESLVDKSAGLGGAVRGGHEEDPEAEVVALGGRGGVVRRQRAWRLVLPVAAQGGRHGATRGPRIGSGP